MSVLTSGEILSLVPQQRPLRFIDDISEVDAEHILGSYVWRPEDCGGYSAGGRVVPPFKLIEMAAQVSSVAWCIYHMAFHSTAEEIGQMLGVLSRIEELKFKKPVYAGEKVVCLGRFLEEGFFRGTKIVSEAAMRVSGGPRNGEEVLSGRISGIWIPQEPTIPRPS